VKRTATTPLGAWLRLSFKAAAQFRAQAFISLFGWVVPLAFMALWNAAAAGSEQMTPNQTTSYYLVMLAATNLSVSGDLIWGFGSLVYSGDLAVLLVQPAPPIWGIIARPLADKAIRFAPLLLILPLLAWGLGADFTSSPAAIAFSLALFAFGWLAALLAAAVWALAGLWMGRAGGIKGLFNGIAWVLGGLIAPSAFMPEPLAWAMRLSPFWAAEGGAAELLSGALSPTWWMLPVNLAWIAVLAFIFRLSWPLALRRFEAVGQ
jgi:ABC-type uncharacterized transport system permease subunit